MAQHDYNAANATGAAFRADLNNLFAAIVSGNSGATEPADTFAYMWWMDTSTNKLKQRNGANNAWLEVWDFSSSNAVSFLAALGSLSKAGFAFYGDPNTGLYSPAADAVAMMAGGTAYFKASAADGAEVLGTAAVKVPVGTSAQRPTGANGHIRYNSELGKFEGYSGSLWSSLGGGGGGGGIIWRALSGSAPVTSEEFGDEVYLFGAGLAQELYTTISVPQSYVAGTQILLYIAGYSPSASNTILMRGQATLIRNATDAIDSTTNQRTTTNSALTNTVAKQARTFTLDLTDSSGQINSVAVSPGDKIKVRLYRDTDTDTADLRILANATDIKTS